MQLNRTCNYWDIGENGGEWVHVHYTAVNVNSVLQTYKLKHENGVVFEDSHKVLVNGVNTLIYDC